MNKDDITILPKELYDGNFSKEKIDAAIKTIQLIDNTPKDIHLKQAAKDFLLVYFNTFSSGPEHSMSNSSGTLQAFKEALTRQFNKSPVKIAKERMENEQEQET